MLIEMAVGDAFGIAFEFVKDPSQHGLVNDLTRGYQQNPRYLDLKPSQYTDDTLRSVATATVVVNEVATSATIYSPVIFAAAIQTVYEADQRPGWSKNFQSYLDQMRGKTARQFLQGIDNRAASNGAIMGCLPLGFLAKPVDVKLAAAAQALATHASSTIPYAQMLALSAHFFLRGGQPAALFDYLNETLDGDDFANMMVDDFIEAPVVMRADTTCRAVIELVMRNTSLSVLLIDAVNLGGDTDSVAALALGLASCTTAYTNDLPDDLIQNLDNRRGRAFLTAIEDKLREKLT